MFSGLKTWLAGLGALLVGLGAAYYSGSRRGNQVGKEKAEAVAAKVESKRREAEHAEIREAVEERRQVEDETDRKGPEHARQNLEDRWTRP